MKRAFTKIEMSTAIVVMCLILLSVPFAFYSVEKGAALVTTQEQMTSRLFHAGKPVSNIAIYAHMTAGGILMVAAPLQLSSLVRRYKPLLHRLIGYLAASLAVFTGAAGLIYIAVQGTIGGPVMDIGFGLYGVLMVIVPLRTIQLARQRDSRHSLWAERLVILALASWLYRVHYGVWEVLTGGAGSLSDFSGPFDIVQVFAFYLPYLVIHHMIRKPDCIKPLMRP